MFYRHHQKVVNLGLILVLLLLVLFPVAIQAAGTPPPPEPGQLDESGNVLGGAKVQSPEAAPLQPLVDPTILCYTTRSGSQDPCARIAGIFSSVTKFGTVDSFPSDLSRFKVVYIGYDEGNALSSLASQLQTFVQNGGGLVVEQPNLVGQVLIYPPGFEMTVSSITWPGFSSPPGPDQFTRAGAFHPILTGLTPADLSGNFDTIPISSLGPGWTVLAKAVGYPNLSLGAGTYGSGRLVFHAGNISATSIDQGSNAYIRQMIEWAGSAVVTPGPDMKIDAMEVTQAIQDLNNSVDLVANKRTYVRVHVSSPAAIANVSANLTGKIGTTTLYPTLLPGNPGADITVLPAPNRGQINDSFWFALPSSWLNAGALTLTARLDPTNSSNDPNLSNNTKSVTVNLLASAPLRLRLFNVQYTSGGTTYLAANSHLAALESWLRRAYPISNLIVARQTFTYPSSGLPNVDTLHGWLAFGKIIRMLFSGEDGRTVYYGVVDDGGGFMRGKALGIPGTIAAGPSGSSDWGWDFDGSYNDWYGGHEIGHTRGRYHAEFCGAAGGAAYPYPNGRISPDLTGNGAIYGFDITTRAIYGPNWKDVMTYCSNEWVSDFTYEGIRSYLASLGISAPDAPRVTADKYLALMGMADLEVNTAELESVNLIQQTATLPLPDPGDWTIALVNGSGTDLATYPFSPDELTDAEESFGTPAVIAEVVPWVDGTTKVEIRYQGSVKASRSASANPPTVAITAPTDGSQLTAGPFTATWTGSDPDGDPLTFSVLFSSDNGITWETLATGLPQSNLDLNTDQLPGGSDNLLRVVASDGFLTGIATSGPFSLPLHAPSVNLELPEANATFYPAQLVMMQASAYDLEDGTLGDTAFQWSSDIDGSLGTGATFSTVNLSTGTHAITVTVTDSDGMSSTATRAIEVVDGLTPEATNLNVDPNGLGVIASMGAAAQTFPMTVRSTSSTEIAWTASDDAAWLSLGAESGTSPSDMNLTVDPAGLKPGKYTATVTVHSAGASNTPVTFNVNLEVLGTSTYLPLLSRGP